MYSAETISSRDRQPAALIRNRLCSTCFHHLFALHGPCPKKSRPFYPTISLLRFGYHLQIISFMIVKTDFSLLAVYFFQTQTYYTISSDLRHPQLLSTSRSSRLFALSSAVSVHVKAKHSLCSARVDNRGHLMGFLRVATKIRIVSCI